MEIVYDGETQTIMHSVFGEDKERNRVLGKVNQWTGDHEHMRNIKQVSKTYPYNKNEHNFDFFVW